MLKYRIKNSDAETLNYQEVGLDSREMKVSLDSKLLSGIFDRSYNIQNGETVSVLTQNTSTYKDVQINTKSISRTGYFTHKEKIEIKEITEVTTFRESVFEEGSSKTQLYVYKMNEKEEYTKVGEKTFINPEFVILTRRYVQMPNGKIYYEKYENTTNKLYDEYYKVNGEINGRNGYFELDFYTYFDDFNEIIEDTTKYKELYTDIRYYVDNDVVTYQGFDTVFSENYRLDNEQNIVLDIIDEFGHNIATLEDFYQYDTPQLYTQFEIEKPSDTKINVERVVPARKYFYIEYKGHKYDLYFKDGNWQVDVIEIENCKEVIKNHIFKFYQEDNVTEIPLQYDYAVYIDAYPTNVVINDNQFPVLSEYRTSIDGDYLFVFTDDHYDLKEGEELTVSFPSDTRQNFFVNEDSHGNFFINYYGKRIYVDDEYTFTISKYTVTEGDSENTSAVFDEIFDEFDVILTDSEYTKFIHGEDFKAFYQDDQGNLTPWFVQRINEDKRYEACKIGYIIEDGTSQKDLSGETKENYKFNVYRTVTIENIKYRTNISKELYELSKEKSIGTPYSISAFTQNRKYDLTIYQYASNWLICHPKINPIPYYYDYGIQNEDDVNSIESIALAPYTQCINEIVSTEDANFYIKDQTFGEEYTPTIQIFNNQNLLDFALGEDFRLFKKINYISFPIRFGSKIETNLNQEMLVDEKFFQVEAEKAINPIIDMEKDIYIPVINNEDGLTDAYEIRFNLHFRTRNLENWKVNNGSFANYENSANKNESNDNWNIIDNYLDYTKEQPSQKASLTKDEVFSSDLLYFLNFTEDDVFYQKSKIGKSFLRLSFYDSPDENSQNLLHMSTIFMNENLLYKKYINNINKDEIKRDDEYTYKFYNQLAANDPITYCSVNTEPVGNKTATMVDYSRDRLDSQFVVKNRYETDTSSEGYYLYMFKEYGTKLRPSPLYMKVEFNHAGEGKVIPFIMPTITNSGLTCMVNDPDSHEITDELSDEGVFNKFKLGIPLSDVTKYQYIKLEVKYDEKEHRYVYYMPSSFTKSELWNNNIMTFNLWELKIKDES